MRALDLPRAIGLAARLVESLRRSRTRLAAVFPISGAAVVALDEPSRTEADAFLKRFENLANRLQDRVFRLVVAAEAVREPSALSRRDMEKFGVIADSDAFSDAVRVRSRLANVCLDEPERQAGQLNAAWSAAKAILSAAATAEARVAGRGLSPPAVSP